MLIRQQKNLKAKFVPIESSKLTSTNKYGRTYSFAMHRLMDKQKAIDLYEKLNGKLARNPTSL